ncbi:MAG: hypothetical protein GC166_07000 [Alphaproteobacteria bacterium]|nr:hypothetical protein [Alphaproteobacteria bacterium]
MRRLQATQNSARRLWAFLLLVCVTLAPNHVQSRDEKLVIVPYPNLPDYDLPREYYPEFTIDNEPFRTLAEEDAITNGPYRIDLGGGADDTQNGAVSTTKKPDTCNLERVDVYPLYDDEAGHVMVPVMMDKRRNLVVDTGGAISTLIPKTVAEMRLEPKQSSWNWQSDLTGRVNNTLVRVPNLTFGKVAMHDATFFVEAADPDAITLPSKMEGVLGPSHLMTFDVELDFGNGTMSLYSPFHCPGKVVHWAKAWTEIPFKIKNGHIQFYIRLDGKSLSAVLDTGAPYSILNMSAAKRWFDITTRTPGVEPIGHLNGVQKDTHITYHKRFQSLSLDGLEIKNPYLVLIPDLMQGAKGEHIKTADLILGLREISALHIYISYREEKIYLTAANAH